MTKKKNLLQELQALREQLEEAHAREKKVHAQHERITRRLQVYLADRGDLTKPL